MSEYWIETKKLFSSLIKKPILTDKLLKKPPPTYIYDIVLESMKITNFPKGFFTEQEEDRKYFISDSYHRYNFLDKLINFCSLVQNIDIKATDIMKGENSEKANTLLQVFYKIVTDKDNTKKEKLINEYHIKLINKLENELNEEKKKTKELETKIISLETELKKYKDNIINDLKKNEESKESLYEKIIEKDNKIKELNTILSRYDIVLNEGEKLLSIIFISSDQKIHHSIICKNTDKFNKVENALYDAYPEFAESENYFTFNGKKINKCKTLDENKINNNDIIMLNTFDI